MPSNVLAGMAGAVRTGLGVPPPPPPPPPDMSWRSSRLWMTGETPINLCRITLPKRIAETPLAFRQQLVAPVSGEARPLPESLEPSRGSCDRRISRRCALADPLHTLQQGVRAVVE